ncbi:MAG: hypothetical protein E7Z80_06580 [Methanobrevibacter thaueri]|nr:hypothetical protein [Methanobrevibacter thaueri]
MDNKGFISIEYLLILFIIIIIASGILFYTSASISSSLNIQDTITHRMILDNLADEINQVNSNGIGYSKNIKLPSDKEYYEITIEKNKLTIEYDNKKGETQLIPANINTKYKLITGKSYIISKTSQGVVIS